MRFQPAEGGGKTYWVEYYDNQKNRRRERIEPSKAAAEQRLRDILKARTEGKYIEKDPAASLSLRELCEWYKDLPEVKRKRSYRRDSEMILHLLRLLGAATKIKDITPGKVESYQRQRLDEPSPRFPGQNTKPATVNKEVTCLKTIINRAVRHGKLRQSLIAEVGSLPENNVRMRVLTADEYDSLYANCPGYLKPVVLVAYYMGMRRSEIVNLTWGEIDLKAGFIRLEASRTKTAVARAVPIHPRVRATLGSLPRGIHTDRVFLFDGEPFVEIKKSYKTACRKAGIEDFNFHDLRHCALNNLRRSGNDYFKIMAMSGHKTMSCFKRYNLVTEEELSQIRWPDSKGASAPVDPYMDTNEKGLTLKTR